MKKFISFFVCVILMGLMFSSCKKPVESAEESGKTEKPTYDRDEGLDPTASTAFFDDFTDPVLSSSLWNLNNSKWGPDFNHGVRPENVSWNDSGIVTIKSYGQYYKDPNKTCQGGVLISRDTYGPGRYETKMKLVPRFGACTAFWTYMYGNSVDLEGNQKTALNQEIDIELNVGNSFKESWFTNWVTVEDKAHVEKSLTFALNDGEWHIYTFEWHTNPMRVDYYIDNVLYYSSFSHVPYVAGALNLGNWFPDGWAGNPDFEESYMQIDYVSYTPYKAQPCVSYSRNPGTSNFPMTSTPLPDVPNLISNAGFEYTYANGNTAWSIFNDCRIVGDAGSKSMMITSAGSGDISTASQIITGASEGFEYKVRAKVKGNGTGNISVYFLKNSLEYIGTPATFDLTGLTDQWTEVEFTFVAPEGCFRLDFTLNCTEGSIEFDDLFMNLKKLMK